MHEVAGLYFMSYALVLQEHLLNSTKLNAVKQLLEWITMYQGVDNKKGEPFQINSSLVYDLETGKRDVPASIKSAVATITQITVDSEKHFEKILDGVAAQRDEDLYRAIWRLIDESDVPEPYLAEWHEAFDKGQHALFMAKVFLYAIQQKAPKAKSKGEKQKAPETQAEHDVLSDRELLNQKIHELSERVSLTPIRKPDEIAPCEQAFVMALFRAYASVSKPNGGIVCKSDLSDPLKRDLEVRRGHFYAAETIRIQGTNALMGNGPQAFSILEDEILTAAYDVCFDDGYANGFDRMKKVMAQIALFHCTKSLFAQTGWIGAAENQGICHILAGEKRLEWVPEDA